MNIQTPLEAIHYSRPVFEDRFDKSPTHSTARESLSSVPTSSVFKALLGTAESDAPLVQSSDWTVFLPTDTAFFSHGDAFVSRLLNSLSTSRVREFVSQFIVPKRAQYADFTGRKIWATNLNGRKILINGKRGFSFEGVDLLQADLSVPGGTVHLMPSLGRSPRIFVPTVRMVQPGR